MRIVVCVRRLANGELNPFDASAYECALQCALQIKNAEVILLSMAPPTAVDFIHSLTRLGAKKAVILSDSAFAGADTLATSYALSLAIKKLSPDLVFCGRQTVDGDTGQVGPELSVMLGIPLVTEVMKLSFDSGSGGVYFETRGGEKGRAVTPSLLTLEKISTLRLPSIRSRLGEFEIWSAADINADISRCGQRGSPTRVIASFKNEQDRRKCKFIKLSELDSVIEKSLSEPRIKIEAEGSLEKLENVVIIGRAPCDMAKTVSDNITVWEMESAENIARRIKKEAPRAILWGSDSLSKRTSASVAALLSLGLCADCTRLEADKDGVLYMYRPAFSGNIIAKIVSSTLPQMATVRTISENQSRIAVGAGFGVKDNLEAVKAFAHKYSASVAASRKLVDHGFMPYHAQAGLTGKSISPDLYIALGISGAVHHIAGIKSSGVIIAVNPDRDAPIFDYADYGIVDEFK